MARSATKTAVEEIDQETGEILSPSRNRPVAQFGFGQVQGRPKVLKHITTPMLEIPPGMSFIAKMVDEVRELPPIEGYKSRYKGPHLASTIEAPNGEVRLLTWTTVLKTEMDKAYADASYVGKWFQITKLPEKRGREGQIYSPYAIAEVDVGF